MPPTRPEIDRALSRIVEKAIAADNDDTMPTLHVIAHVEANLFGYDAGCDDPDCPL